MVGYDHKNHKGSEMRKPITRKEFNTLTRFAKDAMRLASTHDPDLVRWIVDTQSRVTKLELQLASTEVLRFCEPREKLKGKK